MGRCDVIKTHMIETTLREGVRGLCGHRGFPVKSIGDDIIVCKPVNGKDTHYTQLESLVTCGGCLRVVSRKREKDAKNNA